MKRFIPQRIRRPLRALYHGLHLGVVWDKRMIADLSEYLDLGEKEVIFLLKQSKKLHAGLWNALNPKTKEEIIAFYSKTPFYIPQLSFWHMQRYQRALRRKIIGVSRGRILDYGGGTGDLSLELAKRGFDVTYADIGGETFRFADWLFTKYGVFVKRNDLFRESISGIYDTILCIDVIEHVEDPKGVLDTFTQHLSKGGFLVITNLALEGHSDVDPMHNPIHFDAEAYLISLGFKKHTSGWLWEKA